MNKGLTRRDLLKGSGIGPGRASRAGHERSHERVRVGQFAGAGRQLLPGAQ